jgi:hypothetical protein
MTAEKILEEWLIQTDQTNLKEGHYFVIEQAMKEFAELKCKELLEIVAKKADKAHVGGWELDRDEVLNAVDLKGFINGK